MLYVGIINYKSVPFSDYTEQVFMWTTQKMIECLKYMFYPLSVTFQNQDTITAFFSKFRALSYMVGCSRLEFKRPLFERNHSTSATEFFFFNKMFQLDEILSFWLEKLYDKFEYYTIIFKSILVYLISNLENSSRHCYWKGT